MSSPSTQVKQPTVRVVSSAELKAKAEVSKAIKAAKSCSVAPVSQSPVKCLTLEQVNAALAQAKENAVKTRAKKQANKSQ